MSEFAKTLELFRNYTHYTTPLSYSDWMAIPEDHKAAVLYVQFYEQITLAWHKVKSFYTLEEDGVETVIQYLIKNVPIIEEDGKRFKSGYIYRVAYNCLYCICHDYKYERERFENECSNIQVLSDDSVVDLFDTVVDDEGMELTIFRNQIWRIVERYADSDEDISKFLDKILTTGKVPNTMSAKRREALEELRIVLAPYKELFHI